jgi:hypothetical protein
MKHKIVFAALAAGVLFVASDVQGQSGKLPWGQTADQIAWETFAQVVAPSGNPNAKRAEFETWASDEDIYTANPHWPAADAPKRLHQSLLGTAGLVHGRTLEVTAPGGCTQNYDKQTAAAAGFPAGGCIGEEVRRNWASYQYIVSNGLYTQGGLQTAAANKLVVSLPADAVEFKGDWIPVPTLSSWVHLTPAQIHKLYYVNADSAGTEYALVAFHFFTKQQANWVWADFEHENNPGRCDTIGCRDSFGATVPAVRPHATPWQQYGACAKSAAVASLLSNAGLDPVWSHYCLKGSQTTYMTSYPISRKIKVPVPSLLGNSVIEAINAGVPIAQSSCISCHAYASFNAAGYSNPALQTNPRGVPNQAQIGGAGYTQSDFIWGIIIVAPQAPATKAPSGRH